MFSLLAGRLSQVEFACGGRGRAPMPVRNLNLRGLSHRSSTPRRNADDGLVRAKKRMPSPVLAARSIVPAQSEQGLFPLKRTRRADRFARPQRFAAEPSRLRSGYCAFAGYAVESPIFSAEMRVANHRLTQPRRRRTPKPIPRISFVSNESNVARMWAIRLLFACG